MATLPYSRRDEVIDLIEEVVGDHTEIAEKLDHLRCLITDPDYEAYSSDSDED